MFNKQTYKETFDAVHASPETFQEIMSMPSRKKSHISSKQIFTIALAACLVVAFGTVAFATDMFGFRNSAIDSTAKAQQVILQNEDGSYEYAVVNAMDISIAGAVGSAEYDATSQWLVWQDEYMSADFEIDNYWSPADPAYTEICNHYQVYDDTMLNKLLEISSAHGLKLHSDMSFLTDMYAFENALDLSVLIPGGGYIYEDGSMLLDCEYMGETVQVLRNIAGTMPAAYLQIWNPDENAEIAYTNKNGDKTEILLSPGLGKAEIFYSQDDAYIILNAFVRTEEDAKAIADAVDFAELCSAAR